MNLERTLDVLVTDPGAIHTGYVRAIVNPLGINIVKWGEVLGWEASADLLTSEARKGITTWVYEGFRLYKHKAEAKVYSEFEEVQTIGAMRQAARPFPIEIRKQWASEIKIPPLEDKAIEKMGLSLKQMPIIHTRDALRHLLCFWLFKLKGPMLEFDGLTGRPMKWQRSQV